MLKGGRLLFVNELRGLCRLPLLTNPLEAVAKLHLKRSNLCGAQVTWDCVSTGPVFLLAASGHNACSVTRSLATLFGSVDVSGHGQPRRLWSKTRESRAPLTEEGDLGHLLCGAILTPPIVVQACAVRISLYGFRVWQSGIEMTERSVASDPKLRVSQESGQKRF